MTDASGCAFVETKEYRRFREFCDACRRYRSIGLCYGPPGVGKTLSARHYADWDRVASADPYAGRAAFRSDEVPGNGCVLYTAAVVNSPRQIEDEIARLRRKLRDRERSISFGSRGDPCCSRKCLSFKMVPASRLVVRT
jgi:SpoVK/Ycf46/Vps4 family AAA+-type ATPase